MIISNLLRGYENNEFVDGIYAQNINLCRANLFLKFLYYVLPD